jgi:ADP-heptose:LPS heptosyltransferase
MKPQKRILITRTDRLGDVLMSLHAVASVRQQLPETEIDLLVRAEVLPVLRGLMAQWRVGLREYTPNVGLVGYDAALCLFDEPLLLAALKKNGANTRVGNYSKLRSFLSLTHGVRQRRALGKKSEGEYNLELATLFLGVLGHSNNYKMQPLTLPVVADAAIEAAAALKRAGVAPGEPFWVCHPGMGGSALNLSPSAYVKLLEDVARTQRGPLLLTLGPAVADLRLVEAIMEERSDWRVVPRVTLAGVGEVFRAADLVVAPSTGPLHLAHYVGARTLGIYSPVRSHQAKRWAPWGGSGKSLVLQPEHACPGTRDCQGPRCKHFFCLDRLVGAGLPTPLRSALTPAGA